MSVSLRNIARRRQLGAQLDYGHPLLRGCLVALLANEGSGGVRNLMSLRTPNTLLLQNWASNHWKGSDIGICPLFPSNTAGAVYFNSPDTAFCNFGTNDPFTLYVYATPPTVANSAHAYYNHPGPAFNPSFALGGHNTTASVTNIRFHVTSADLDGTTNLLDLIKTRFYSICATHDSVAGKIFLDGVLENSNLGSTISTNSSNFQIGGSDDGNRRPMGWHGAYLVWNRVLSQDEVRWLSVEPFDWVLEPVYRRYFIGALGLQPLTQTAADQMNTMADSVSLLNGAAAGYGVILSDTTNFLADAISLIGGDPDYQLTFGDSLNALNDSQRILLGLLKTFSDTVNNLADTLAQTLGYPVSVFDSNQFNWADSSTVALGFAVIKSDTIFNLDDAAIISLGSVIISISKSDTMFQMADAIRLYNTMRLVLGDNFVLSDSLRLRFTNLLRTADTINQLADALGISLRTRPAFSDSMDNLSDAVSLALTVVLRKTVADQMVMTDAVSVQLNSPYNPDDVDFIRRYLNDTVD
jgi:hypothetical protein